MTRTDQIMALASVYALDHVGGHAALRAEVQKLEDELKEWEAKAANWLASPEAAQCLEDYRELAKRAEKAEAERDRVKARVKQLENGYDTLRTQLRRTEKKLGECDGGYKTMEKEVCLLKAECERLRKDAERYRWLQCFGNFGKVDAMLDTTAYNTLDAAIDAAIAQEKT